MLKTAFQFFAVFTVLAVQNSCFAQISTFSGIPANSPPNFGSVSSVSSFPNAFSSASATSGTLAPGFLLDPSSSEQLNKEKSSPLRTQPTTSFFLESFQSPGPSSAMSSIYQISPIVKPSPVESFITELNAAVYTSNALPDIFDLRDLSVEAFSKSLYDYVYACGIDTAHNNPHYIASMVATPIMEGIDTYTLPVTLDIYANAIAKYLFAKGTLNSANASSLARKYAKIVEESAERNWAKETPESKFLALEEGFTDFMKSIDHFSVNTIEDLAVYFANEVKRVANKS